MQKYILHTRDLFMKFLCCIYMFAFGSLYFQIPGLYGNNGILPAKVQIPDDISSTQCFLRKKTLLCFAPNIGVDIPHFMELLALLGTAISFIGFVWKVWCTSFLFLCLWSFYLSLYQVGQTFLWFQWDILLLEIGLLAIIVAPIKWNRGHRYHPRNMITMWLVKWALFRLMFASGVVKLQSECPTWWGLTALNYHYETQCIPTPLSWFAHQLPEWFQKLCVVSTFVIEIPIPFMFFSPVRDHRIFAFFTQVLLQVMIILTGNYNFFNLTALALCLSLIDDVFIGCKRDFGISTGYISWIKKFANWAFKWIGFGALGYFIFVYFSLKLAPGGIVLSEISFSKTDFATWVSKAVPFSVIMGSSALLLTVAEALTSALFEIRGNSKKFFCFMTTLCYAIIAFLMFGISLVPYTVLDPPTRDNVWPIFKQMYTKTSDLHVTSSYGLFRRMTGVEGRPEVILEGSNSPTGPWQPYEFPSKPGSIDRPLPFIMPHQPRLDWNMWFAALGSYGGNPWLVSLSYKLLSGEKDVIALLDKESPWRTSPPKYIRGQKYKYHYTSYNDHADQWWKRTLVEEYMPVFSVDHEPLITYLKNQQLIGNKNESSGKSGWIATILDLFRNLICELEPHIVLWALFLAGLIIIFTIDFMIP